MPEFKRKDGSPLFASQIELNLSINGWDHKSLLFVPPANFDAKVYSDVYAESKEEINPAQAARFTESLANAPVPYLVYDSAAGLWTLGTKLAAPPTVPTDEAASPTASATLPTVFWAVFLSMMNAPTRQSPETTYIIVVDNPYNNGSAAPPVMRHAHTAIMIAAITKITASTFRIAFHNFLKNEPNHPIS